MIPLDPAILEFEYEWREGDRAKAIQIAKDFINLYRTQLSPIYSRYTREDLVHEMDELRKCGASKHHDRLVTDMWILSEYPLGEVTGVGYVTIKIPETVGALRSIKDGSIHN